MLSFYTWQIYKCENSAGLNKLFTEVLDEIRDFFPLASGVFL